MEIPMSNLSETGHAKVVANFEALILSCESFGAAYNPSRPDLKLEGLRASLVSAQAGLQGYHEAQSASKHAIAAREEAFEPFSRLMTRVQSALRASSSSAHLDDRAKSVVRTLQGRRAAPRKAVAAPATNAVPAGTTDSVSVAGREVSASRMGYDTRLSNFDQLIQILSTTPEYTPNEAELRLDSLKAHHQDLATKNSAVLATDAALSHARSTRDNSLYGDTTGLADLATDAKAYVRSLYGSSSPEFQRVSGIVIRNRV
jgi:phage-related tail protein